MGCKTQSRVRGLSFLKECCFTVRVRVDTNPEPKKIDFEPDPTFY